jgi:hypothetical protein
MKRAQYLSTHLPLIETDRIQRLLHSSDTLSRDRRLLSAEDQEKDSEIRVRNRNMFKTWQRRVSRGDINRRLDTMNVYSCHPQKILFFRYPCCRKKNDVSLAVTMDFAGTSHDYHGRASTLGAEVYKCVQNFRIR